MKGVVFANGQFVAVGAGGVASISSDSTSWVESTTATTNNLNVLAYLNGLFVAVGDGGAVETSADGLNWTLQASGITNSLGAVAFANGNYVAVGASAVITSPDAVNWFPAVSGLSGAAGVAGGSAGFVAVDGTGSDYYGTSNKVFFSSNGSMWTSQTLTVLDTGNPFFHSSLQNSIVTYADGAYLIGSYRYASSGSADQFVFRSIDGNNWTTNALGNVLTGIGGFGYNFFFSGSTNSIAAGYAGYPFNIFFQFSSDGINWATTNASTAFYSGTAGTYGQGTFVVVAPAWANSPIPQILTSTNCITWTNRQLPLTPPVGPTDSLTSIAFSNGIYIATGSGSFVRSTNGLVYVTVSNSPALASAICFSNGFVGVGAGGKIYVSGDGLSWTQRNSGTLNNLHGITGTSWLVAVGDNGAIQTSPTGTIWTSRTSGTSLALYSVVHAGDFLVAVGQLGTVLTSLDGITWTGQDSGQLTDLLSVTYGAAGYVAVGLGGTILTSPDGITWAIQNSGVSAALESVAFGNGYYLAVGNGATALSSPDGINWAARNIGLTGGQNLLGAAFLNNRFEVVGSGGTILESDVIAPLFDLQIHGAGNGLTVFAPPGSNFRIQTTTNLAAPIWIDAVSFDNAAAITRWTNSASESSQLFYRAVAP